MNFTPDPILYDNKLAHPRTDFLYTEVIDEAATDGIIDFYKNQKIFSTWAGETIGDDGGGMVNTDIKDSIVINTNDNILVPILKPSIKFFAYPCSKTCR